ncbi:MAG: hypothetical protein AABX07_01935 [Nanoarchaeota archaeon]
MNLIAISISLFFLLSFVSAANLEITSPSEANLNENFSVTIISDIAEKSDVKIYLQNSEAKIFSEIFSSGWKSSFYYVLGAFPEKTEYLLKAVKSAGDFEICAKLRKSGKTSITSSNCTPITIKPPQNSNENKPADAPNKTEAQKENSNGEAKDNEEIKNVQNSKDGAILNPPSSNLPVKSAAPASSESAKESQTTQQILSSPASEKLILNSIQKPGVSEYITSQEKLRLTAIYLFPFLVILILILIIFNKI